MSAIVCYDVGVSIASTSVTPEHRTDVGVKFGEVPAHRFVRKVLRIRQRNSGTHLRVLCVGSPTLRDRLIESQPTLGLWVMSAADKGATVTAEQSDAPLWSQNSPPQLS
ncbi:hypothetical protein [uncultured Duncaniella sp.]|uniref:hypothetical protein n=1 Tax=uncultured Duncaniella sp. TaxID=2768039 RepID=UPI002675C5B2|nr:hypothetical protein [uncultured Duncaniella sp.]